MSKLNQMRITNTSGAALRLTCLPSTLYPGGVSLAASGASSYLDVPGDLVSQLTQRQRGILDTLLDDGYIQIEQIPIYGAGDAPVVQYSALVSSASSTWNPTGKQADIVSGQGLPFSGRLCGGEFVITGRPAAVTGKSTREFALFDGDGNQVTYWQSIALTGSGAKAIGEIVRLDKINPTASALTAGQTLELRSTGFGSSSQATGYMQVQIERND